MDFKKEIIEKIKTKRPNLSVNSIRTYTSLLFNLQKKLNDKKHSMKWFTDSEAIILESLKDMKDVSKKTILAAYYILEEKQTTKKIMLKSAKIVNDKNMENKKTEKQEKNWISQDEVDATLEKYKKLASSIMKKKVINNQELFVLRDYMVLLFYVKNKPRRSLDLSEMKIRNIDKKGNYIQGNNYVFNIYKTNKYHGEDRIPIHPDAVTFIKLWKTKYNMTDYLVFNEKQNQISSSQITRLLNGIFGKNVSTSMLRHIYLSDKFKNMPTIKEMQEVSADLGHTLPTMLTYIKK
mgnify:FL=1